MSLFFSVNLLLAQENQTVETATTTDEVVDNKNTSRKKTTEINDDILNQQAFEAIKTTDLETLKASFHPHSFYAHNTAGETLLTQAIKDENETLVDFLEPHAVINIKNEAGETPLTLAIKTGNPSIIATVAQRAKASLKNEAGETPLFLALQHYAHLTFLKTLLDKGAKVNRPSNGVMPLYKAVELNKLSVVALFIKSGADPSLANTDGTIPLFLAVQNGQEQIAGMLLYNSKDMVKDANWTSNLGEPILLVATTLEQVGIVKSLLRAGANIDGVDYLDNTAMNIAANLGNAYLLEVLLENGADINHQNMLGVSPILAAVEAGQYATAEFLAAQGADKDMESVAGFAATDYYGFAGNNNTSDTGMPSVRP
ncbi:MAG: ankyrin repeat domain-containing protein [Bacteroidota bacterium]